MEATINNQSILNDPKELEGIVLKINTLLDVERIYLSQGTERNPFKYRMTIITSLLPRGIATQIQPVITSIFEDYPDYKYSFFSLQYVNQELHQGNLYFHNHCLDKYLVYKDTSLNAPWVLKTLDLEKVYEKAKTRFKRDISKVKSFKKGVKFYLNRKDHPQAAFMVHQTYELTYRMLESFITGSVKICHSISNHESYVEGYITPLKGVFSKHSEADKTLLKLLDDAYGSSRYTHHYTITEQEMQALNLRVSLFIKEVIRLFNQELLKFQNEVYYNATNITEANCPIKKTKKNSNKNYKKLKRIKELSKENFKLLTPIGGKHNGYYLNYVRVYDYVELFSTLKSMLNVSILALEGQQDLTLHIKNIESDVKTVLEFAKKLIPFEEAIYLDKMRELMLSKKERK
ncbi:hypothetical protein GCM10023311_08180 [Flaviramulus aquimarinus]|uniref:HEPN domain-containing protein n=1 Tax=Flaviramulus aquimarinus TaxID=1170456 RepID=A0ABP9EU12_9FLAO